MTDVRTNDIEHVGAFEAEPEENKEDNAQEVGTPKEHRVGDKKFKCEQCPYSSPHKCIMMAHIKVVHEDIKDYVCCNSKECGFVASQDYNLNQHKKSVHKVKDEKFWCRLCSHSNNLKKCLLSHMKYVHKVKDTRFKI